MKKIIFEGSEAQLQNVLNLVSDFDEDRLPNMTVISERDIFIERLGHYVSDDAEVSYNKLLKQSEIDGNVSADDVVMVWEPLEYKYTVNQLLDEITY